MTKNTTGAESVLWDLSFMYSGVSDPQIKADVARMTEEMRRFNLSYKGKLAENLGKAIKDYAEIKMLKDKVMVFLFLKQSTNVSDAATKAKMAETEQAIDRAQGEYLTFFELELVAIEDAVLEKLYAADPVVAKHRPWIEHLRVFKPHFLSESVEAALTKRSAFGPGAWGEFFDELESDLRFTFRGEEKTLPEMLHLITESKDPEERAEAMQAVNACFRGSFAKYSAQTLYMVVGAKAVESAERGYRHPMDKRNKSNRIPDPVVEALHDAVEEAAAPLTQRHYRLKAAHLGLKTLRWSDRNAPLPFADTATVAFDEAMATVLAAYESFSPTLAGLIRDTVAAKRIDAPAIKGKRGGAFNYSLVLPGSIPVSFTMLNYLGSNRDVMTLAHELGHGVHGVLAGKAQGALMFRAPTAYAETASVFGELTTFRFLKQRISKHGDTKSLIALIMGKIDDIVNTMVRQISFSNFERRLHGFDSSSRKWNEPKKLSVDELNTIWLETTKALYGEAGRVFTYENAEYLWSYVHHFHSPFYVYGYAFGELLAHSLYAQKERLGDRFEPLYLDLLRAGGTKDVIQLLKPFDLDPTDKKFWADGIKVSLGALIDEAERLSQTIGVSG
ncbi:MAG: M3 family oligoendopeptidase [Candidatus Liptonbacteria bacterium]|nr:M3 family oligoendopeptidase [Candidatus Liptonbacteria bacterium]